MEAALENAATPRARLDALVELGRFLRRRDARRGLEACEAACRLARELRDDRSLVRALAAGAFHRSVNGDLTGALHDGLEALHVARAGEDPGGVVAAHSILGIVSTQLGDLQAAIRHFEAELDVMNTLGDTEGRPATLGNLGAAYSELGDAETALRHFQEARDTFAARGNTAGEASMSNNVGVALLRLGRFEAAHAAYEYALLLARRLGQELTEGISLGGLGAVAKAAGRYDEALVYIEGALDLAVKQGRRPSEASNRQNRGGVLMKLGRYDEALAELERTLEIARAIGHRRLAQGTHQFLAHLHEQRGDYQRALEHERLAHTLHLDLQTADAEREAKVLAVKLDLARLREAATTLERESREDALTGVLNRRGLEDALAKVAPDETFAVVMLDVDHFKRVNDSYSHAVGDEVLRSVARVVKRSLRSGSDGRFPDLVARYGGEEFTLILRGVDAAGAVDVAERLRTELEAHDWSDVAPSLQLTASFGVAVGGGAASVARVLSAADEALYVAKQTGRNRVVFASGEGLTSAPP